MGGATHSHVYHTGFLVCFLFLLLCSLAAGSGTRKQQRNALVIVVDDGGFERCMATVSARPQPGRVRKEDPRFLHFS